MTLFLVSNVFLATASSRPRHDWILEYAPPFFDYYYFFPSSYLRQAFNTIPNSSVSDTTRYDTILFFPFFFFLSFFLELKMEIRTPFERDG